MKTSELTTEERITNAISWWRKHESELLPLFPFRQKGVTYHKGFPGCLSFWIELWEEGRIGKRLGVAYVLRPIAAIREESKSIKED